MLRFQTQESDGALICRLEGRFTGKGAEEVRALVTRCDIKLELVVDLTDVMFIDTIGEEVLLFVKRLGAQFVAETSYLRTASAPVGRHAKQRVRIEKFERKRASPGLSLVAPSGADLINN